MIIWLHKKTDTFCLCLSEVSGTQWGSSSRSASGSRMISTPPLSNPSPLLSNPAHTVGPVLELNQADQYGVLVGNRNSRQPVDGRGQYNAGGEGSFNGQIVTTTYIHMEQRQQEQDQSTKQQQQQDQSHSHRRGTSAEERTEKAEIRKQRNLIAAYK